MPILKNASDMAGTIKFVGGSATPAGYLYCDGSVLSRSTYPSLFDMIGTAYNIGGETSLQFRLPDLRGKTPVGQGQDTGRGLTNRVIGSYGGTEVETLLASQIGAHEHSGTTNTQNTNHTHPASLATTAAMLHDHNYNYSGWSGACDNGGGKCSVNSLQGSPASNFYNSSNLNHSHSFTTAGPTANHNHTFTTNLGNAGSNGTGGSADAHTNIQPSMVSGFYIKY